MIGRSSSARRRHRTGDTVGDPDERDHIACVVLEDRRDDGRIALPQVIEIGVGNQRAGNVGHATIIEDALLELAERGRPEAVAPQPSGGMEQIEMRFVDRDLAPQRHDEARAKYRQVERLAVVRAACAERLDLIAQRGNEAAFRGEVKEQMLP